MVLWQVDRDKWQREKDLLNWERTAGEGEQGGSPSVNGCVLLSQFSKGAGEHPCWCKDEKRKRRKQQNRQKTSSEGRRGQGEGTPATGGDHSEERAAEEGQGHPQQQSSVVSAVSHMEN